MKIAFLKYGSVFIALILSATMLMRVSQNVQRLEKDIVRYDREIAKEKDKIRVLKAEWAYLNNPERLEILASGGYNMRTPEMSALISDSAYLSPAYLSNTSTSRKNTVLAIRSSYRSSLQNKTNFSLHPQTKGERE